MKSTISSITQNIIQKSRPTRQAYLDMLASMAQQYPPRRTLSCGNVAHGCAANSAEEKRRLQDEHYPNIAIITAYNDLLSAHQPLADYPALIKSVAFECGATAQVAGGVPAMCDGITQGQPGMDLSLFSREVVAMATTIALSHNIFDAAMCLGVCDKIVPGLLIGALQFGHLPFVFVPAGPMPTGISNKEKALVRQQFAQGHIGRDSLLATEMASYHSPGTCTFYGTANTNQVLMEALGVQLAGTSFIQPGTELRDALTTEATKRVLGATEQNGSSLPLKDIITEKSIVNALVLLMATGGSTNLTLHLIAIAQAAGIIIDWHDMDMISKATPLLARIYPNGLADVNHFEKSGGLAFVISELRKGGLLNEEVMTIMGAGLDSYTRKPFLNENKQLQWSPPVTKHNNVNVLSTIASPFAEEGGLRVVSGNLGTGLVKLSAVEQEHRVIEAPCKVFDSQDALKSAFEKGELHCDHVAAVRFQGPSSNGMPELHKLTPFIGALQDEGYQVALITDGRMSGASGKILAAIHVSPEAKKGGLLAYVQTGDRIRVDANNGVITLLVPDDILAKREPAVAPKTQGTLGRRLFAGFREVVGDATDGASVFHFDS